MNLSILWQIFTKILYFLQSSLSINMILLIFIVLEDTFTQNKIIYIVIGNRLRWAHLGESVADVSHWWLARIGSPGLFLKILNYLPSIFMDLKISHKNLDPILRIKILTQNSWHWTVPFFFRCIHFPVCHNPHCCLILLQYYLPDPCSI